MKRISYILLLSILVFSLLSGSAAFAQDKTPPEILKELGVLKGDKDGNLMLDSYLKRQDMVVLISRLYKEENKATTYLLPAKFSDLNENNTYYHGFIQWAADKNLIIGMDDGSFGFGKNVKVRDFQVLLLRVLDYREESGLYDSVPEIADKLGLMKGINVNPNGYLMRRTMADMTLNALKLNKKGSPLTLAEVLELDLGKYEGNE
ncbi:MAG: S-layer homology domain-containing protein [Gudongella sp.]|nr:S-layer homology domain-containing protein [Gudongella sp.]